MNMPKISVIVPCHNAASTIRACVQSILASSYPDFECIVVDDASLDGSVESLKGLNCRLIRLPANAGPGASRNAGAREARGEILAFTDADCRVPPQWLSRIREALDDSTGAVSAGYNQPLNREPLALFQFYDTLFRQRNTPELIETCISANLGLTKKVFEEVGGFLPQYYGEDTSLGLAISRKYTIKWDRNNGVAHYFNAGLRKFFIKHLRWTMGLVPIACANRNMPSKKTTWSFPEIARNLIFLAGFYISVLLFCFLPFGGMAALLLLAAYILNNSVFFYFVARRENYKTALKLLLFMPVRDSAWLCGLSLGTLKIIFRRSTS